VGFLDAEVIEQLLDVLGALFDAEGVLVERAAVVARSVVADELILFEEGWVELERGDQAIGDAGAVNAQDRLSLPKHRVP